MTARPPRIGVVLPEQEGLLWATRLFTGLSRIWGGGSFSALPPSLLRDPIWRRLVGSLDPDRVVPLERTLRGRFLGHDAEADKELEIERLARLLATRAGISQSQAFDHIVGDQDSANLSDSLDSETIEWLRSSCAPLDRIGQPGLALGAPVQREFSDILHWVRGDLGQIQLLKVPIRSQYLDLLVTSRIGGLDAEYWAAEVDRGYKPLVRHVSSDDLGLLLEYCWLGSTSERQLDLRRAMEQARGNPRSPEPAWFADDFQANTPLQRSLQGCRWLAPAFDIDWDRRPLVVVIGDSVEDFALHHMTRQLLAGSVWLPYRWAVGRSRLADEARSAVTRVIGDFALRRGERDVVFTSMSLSQRSVRLLARKTAGVWAGYDFVRVSAPEGLNGISASAVVADEATWETHRWAPFVGERQGDQVDTPVPPSVRLIPGKRASWHVDVGIEGYRYPIRAALREAMSAAGAAIDSYNVRPSTVGVSFWTEGMFQLAGQEMRHTVIRPRLRTPSALEVFNLLLADRGLACRYSDKGDFTFNAIRLWGGLDEIARDFSSFRKAAFFKDFLSDQESGAGPGVSLKSTNRRYLTFWDARRITSMDRENLRIWIDSLVDREIVSRGLIMRCSRCRYAAWYPGTRVGRTFECDRCRSEQTVDHAHWKAPSEPMWFYELSEVVFQALGFDTTEVVLALSELKNRSRQGFLYEPQMEIVSDGETISELDIWAIADGKVIVGEAKSAGRLGATAANEEEVARRVRSVADAASADVAIFATTADGEWRAATVRTVQEVFSNSVADLDWMSGLAPTS